MPETWAFASLKDLGAALRAGHVSSRGLTDYFLDRLERHGPQLNALVSLTRDRALLEAEEADEELARGIDRGPLHGIPYGAKDLLATADYPTTWGAEPFRHQEFADDAHVISKLRAAGAVLIGKLAMVELAGGWGYDQPNAALTGPGLNAWSDERWAGGSSSGSGAAVGAGLVPFAIGTETWGSIHCPSVFNGITGLRPTYGRVGRSGAMALSWTLDKIGPMARSAGDCWMVLEALAGADPDDEITIGAPALGELPEVGPIRFGVLRGSIEKSAPGVAANARAAIEVLRQFGTVTESSLPDMPWDEAATTIIACEAASAFEDFLDRGDGKHLTAPEDRSGVYHAQQVPAVDYLRALRIRAEGARQIEPLLADFDVLVAPSYSVEAPPAVGSFDAYFDKHEADSLSAVGNLLGLPSIAVPTGLGDAQLPTGIELLGRWWTEALLTRVATQFQERTNWHDLRPPQWDPDCAVAI